MQLQHINIPNNTQQENIENREAVILPKHPATSMRPANESNKYFLQIPNKQAFYYSQILNCLLITAIIAVWIGWRMHTCNVVYIIQYNKHYLAFRELTIIER